MAREHWVCVFEVAWDGLWDGIGVLRASESKADPTQQSGVSQVVEVWGCRQYYAQGLRKRAA